MGTFLGHALPGTIFIMGGLWWAINAFSYYFYSKTRSGPSFRCRPWYDFPWSILGISFRDFPVDGLFIVIVTSIGMIGELITAFDDGRFAHLGNGQHMTMYFFFWLAGVCHFLGHYNFMVPPGIEVGAGMAAYAIEGFLFYFHLHGRPTMDKQVHLMLFVVIMLCVLSIYIEVHHQTSLLATLARAYFTLLQGTWFYQIGFILYPPLKGMQEWDTEDHEQMMIVTLIFTWHAAVDFVIVLVMGLCIGALYKRLFREDFRNERISYQSLDMDMKQLLPHKSGTNGHVVTKLYESDSDEIYKR